MPLRLFFGFLIVWLLPGFSLHSGNAVQSAGSGQFPAIQVASLDGTQFHLPQNFGGQLNLVIVSFAREQQQTVDSWIPAARQLEALNSEFRYYELPTMSRQNIFYRWWFDAALRSNTTDKQLRARILMAYVNMHTFRESLHVPNEKNVIVLLIDQSGRVFWRTQGAYTEEKRIGLNTALSSGHQ